MLTDKLLKKQKDIFDKGDRILTQVQVEALCYTVCKHFDIKYEELFIKTRKKAIVLPRMWCMYFMYHIYTMYSPDVSVFFGYKDHTTLMYTRNKIKDEIDSYKQTLWLYHFLDTQIRLELKKHNYKDEQRRR